MSERERLARQLEDTAPRGEAGDWERIVAYTLRYGNENCAYRHAKAAHRKKNRGGVRSYCGRA